MREIDTTYESWSRKRLIIGLLAISVLVVLGVIVKDALVKDKNFISLLKNPGTAVAGISTKKDETENSSKNSDEKSNGSNSSINSLKSKINIQERLDSIKKEFSSLNTSDIASSSPQFKKVMEDIQNLKNLPKNQAKEACFSICRGI